ncbi:hypothetical protein BN2537_2501 [Streptomyces venezuelae]|nr:hypothetical protein BN2537_2501 [Streptomyces venezuelae]
MPASDDPSANRASAANGLFARGAEVLLCHRAQALRLSLTWP